MSESELSSYQLQLQQVEAALTSDPANSELLKLKADLEQVIDLTKELVAQSVAKASSHKEVEEEDEPPGLLPEFEDLHTTKSVVGELFLLVMLTSVVQLLM